MFVRAAEMVRRPGLFRAENEADGLSTSPEVSMDMITLIGLLAGALTTIAFLPQLTKTWKSKSAKDISLGMFLTFCTGVLLWLIYGILINALPVILANTVTLILSGAILALKLKYG
jgi:MtN3 and saliva related transmembrane protein